MVVTKINLKFISRHAPLLRNPNGMRSFVQSNGGLNVSMALINGINEFNLFSKLYVSKLLFPEFIILVYC